MPNNSPFFEEKQFDACLSCGSTQLELMALNPGSDVPPGGEFMPIKHKLKLLRESHGVSLKSYYFQMCKDCGLVFRQDSPYGLNDFLKRYAKD